MRTPIINVMDRAARRAGRNLARDFGEVQQLQVSRKGAGDFVAAAVRKASQTLRYELEKARPDFAYLDEGQSQIDQTATGHRWIVCPLDGTLNYLHGQPHFAIAIAHEESGILANAIVYDPLREELFWAVRNTGAFLNDVRLRVSARQHLQDCVVATGMPQTARGNDAQYVATLTAVAPHVGGVRQFGTPALDLAYVAAGRLDGYWGFDLAAQDIAAGVLIIREAGGFVSDGEGRDAMMTSGGMVAANDQIHEKLLRCVRAAGSVNSAVSD